MKVLDLFSGIGGFSLGLERAGMETIAFCEIEEYPRSILKKHWPEIPIFEDVKKLTAEELNKNGIGPIDVICGGFPCQPFSVAGKQRGEEDDRHLWPEMFRLIKECKPDWVIGENVAGFVKMALDDVLFDLESEGYETQSFVIPACAVGGIHRRDRVWIIAHAKYNGAPATKKRGSSAKSFSNDKKGQDKTIKPTGIRVSSNVAYSSNERLQRKSVTGGNGKIRQKSYDKLTSMRSRAQKFEPISTPTQPAVRSRDDGLPDNVARLKALGNAVVPQIPELIGRAIIKATKESQGFNE